MSQNDELKKDEFSDKNTRSRIRKSYLLLGLALVIVVLAAVMIPVGFAVIKPRLEKPAEKTSLNEAKNSPKSPDRPTFSVPESAQGTVLDPSTWMDHEDFNTTFTDEKVGGLSIMGLNSSWDDSKRANEEVPALNEKWDYSKLPMRGVNLGGWLVLEPFITPSFFETSGNHSNVDEFTLSENLLEKNSTALKSTLESHYKNWVTKDTMKEIAAAGLDHVRIPYPYWLMKVYEGDPYLAYVGWRYLLRGIEWAREYGLRVVLDLHAVPGSQNGWNHSGREGRTNWLNGTDGEMWGNQSIELHEQLAEFFSQPRYKNIITMYGLVNEPKLFVLSPAVVTEWTKRCYHAVREAGFDNYILYSDGFLGPEAWFDVFPEDKFPKMVLDLHEYTIFNIYNIRLTHKEKVSFACENWAQVMTSSTSKTGHGPTIVGEFSQADTDCNQYINSVTDGARWDGTYRGLSNNLEGVTHAMCPGLSNCSCDGAQADPSTYDKSYIEFLNDYGQAQMHTFETNGAWGFLYWTWDVEKDASAQWSYKKAMKYGLLPKVNNKRTFSCNGTIPAYEELGLSEKY